MSDISTMDFLEAASRLGVPVWVLRRAIRTGKIPAQTALSAVATLSTEWLASVQAVMRDTPDVLSRRLPQRVPPFARYEGTSAWRKYARKVRDYAHFRAAEG
jgi:hypothetical protein